MPTYEYACIHCDKDFSFERSIKDDDPGYVCDECGNMLIRSYSPFSIQFKGSGFYKNDSKKG